MKSDTIVLLRTATLTSELHDFGVMLQEVSKLPVAVVVNKRLDTGSGGSLPRIGLSDTACRELGLFCPSNFAWKCGDYGLYLARYAYPQAKFFWLIESDVRFYGGQISDFFNFFIDHRDIDFLGANIQPATREWYWTDSARGRNISTWRCFFPITRTSVEAVDVLLAKRVEHSGDRLRRRLWPNDEAFVATTLVNAGLSVRDLNGFGREFCEPSTFGSENIIHGDTFVSPFESIHVTHPVLFGDAYGQKTYPAPRPFAQVQLRRMCAQACRLKRW